LPRSLPHGETAKTTVIPAASRCNEEGGKRANSTRRLSPDGGSQGPANALDLHRLTFAVDDVDATVSRLQALGAGLVGEVVDYGDAYCLCYIRGPEGTIVEAEKLS
jgi:catechol 2,3-dioxygenase-like lactoylglutathione lyase family enzyme